MIGDDQVSIPCLCLLIYCLSQIVSQHHLFNLKGYISLFLTKQKFYLIYNTDCVEIFFLLNMYQ
jgi:hypothetical protein